MSPRIRRPKKDDEKESDFSMRTLNQVAKKLDITPGSIVAVKSGTALANKLVINDLLAMLKEHGLGSVFVVVVDDFEDLTVIEPRKMRQMGWVHVSTFGHNVRRKLVNAAVEARNAQDKET